jgi:hypothetical protein
VERYARGIGLCGSLRVIMTKAMVHTFLLINVKERSEKKRYVGAVVSLGSGLYRFGSHVILH